MAIVPGASGDFCLGAYYGYAGGGVNDGDFLAEISELWSISLRFSF